MAISRDFTQDAIWLKVTDKISCQELSEGLDQAITDEGFFPGKYLILDFQGYKAAFSSHDLGLLATLLGEIKDKFLQPIITLVSDDLRFGLMRILDAFSAEHGYEIKIFRNEREVLNFFPVFCPEKNESYQESL